MSRANKRIRKGDQIIVIAGNYKGHRGEVLEIVGDKALVRGINVRKKHVRKSQQNPNGGIVEMEMPIHLSNVQLSPEEGVKVRLRAKIDANEGKQLYYVHDEKQVVYRNSK
jgi:large subunit ribosomal protein L24